MPGDALSYDGHTILFGVDRETDPIYLQSTTLSKAVNRTFRGGKNHTRPPFREIEMVFSSDEDRDVFRYGNFQGASAYRKHRPARYDGIVCSVAGVIFFLRICGKKAYVAKVFTGNNPKFMHTFYAQAVEWMYIQNGEQLPIFWDGLLPSEARRSLGPNGGEMPVGTLMGFAHGRVGVTNPYNQILFSDIMFGKGFTNTKNVQKFTEGKYWQEGGYFSVPAELGDITGIAVLPMQNVNLRGEGEFVVLCERGAITLDVSLPRKVWIDQNIQRTALIGRGAKSPWSVTAVNGDLWFLSDDGWSSYTNSRIDFQSKTAFRKFSREVNPYINGNTPWMSQFVSHAFFDNRLIGTIQPQKQQAANSKHGSHRYSKGMVVLDLDGASGTMGGNPINWDGLWTGPRPTQILVADIEKEERCFVFSFGRDEQNRIFELDRNGTNDEVSGKERYIESMYVTKALTHGKGGEFALKTLNGGAIWLSDMTGDVELEILYRSNNSRCWHKWFGPITNKARLVNEKGFSAGHRRWKRYKLPSPDPRECDEGSLWPGVRGETHTVAVMLKGTVQIDRLRTQVGNFETKLQGDACIDNGIDDMPLASCGVEDDFAYIL